MSSVLAEYSAAFAADKLGEDFLTYYSVRPDKSFESTTYTRGDFQALALKAAHVIDSSGLVAGACHTHFFSKNTVGDLAFRLASVMLGTVPVTINWQADTPERVLFKLSLTDSLLMVVDDGTPKDVIAMCVDGVSTADAKLAVFDVAALDAQPMLASGVPTASPATSDASRIVIFTSGTTGNPKGVRLSYKAYSCNRATFEDFLEAGEGKELVAVVVNPMHHTNSTSITDWALRKPGARLHLVERYTTLYWSLLACAGTPLTIEDAAADEAALVSALGARDAAPLVVVAPLVSRHFDFLDGLLSGSGGSGSLPLSPESLRAAMQGTILLLGSAPVGPTTVARLQKFAGKLPIVRFGSTETCLQVMGTPLFLSESQRLAAFEAGWRHQLDGREQVGYYIGRPHPPYTECRIVKSVSVSVSADGGGSSGDGRSSGDGFVDCADGEPGQLITRGENLMGGYVGDDAATAKALVGGGWYTNLGDVCFRLASPVDGGYDYYWQSRDSALLIRGGANYAYEQINAELQRFVASTFGVAEAEVEVAVVGLRVESEHEDDCCVTLELSGAAAEQAKAAEIEAGFLAAAKASKGGVSKGAKPDHVRLAPLPRNFKGAIKLPDLKEEWRALLKL